MNKHSYLINFAVNDGMGDQLVAFLDADAFMTHMGNTLEAMPKLMEMATPTSVSVFGTPEGPALEALKGLGATFHTPIAGFER